MMRVLSQPDWRDAMSLPAQDIDWGASALDPRGLRIGLQLDAGWGMPLDPQVRRVVEDAARRFESAGAIVEAMPAFMTREMAEGMDRFWRMRSWLDLSALPAERRDKVLPYIREWASTGATLTATQVFQGQAQMAAMRDAAVAATQPFDFVLSPVAPCVAFAAEWASPLNDPQRPFEHIAFTLPWNMSEQPAASIHAGFNDDGLPVGLQVIGHRHDDLGVLRLCRWFEQQRGEVPAWPQPPAR
jgi:Asp-tRNA(Asn)/Glu-tRNA(Gln) amidotransferase A subunit family amidase